MFLVRFILVLAFITSCSLGKADKQSHASIFQKNTNEKTISFSKTILKENKENKSPVKRKIKPKGTEVLVPNITPDNFKQHHCFTIITCSHLTQAIFKPYYDSNGKRGPPAPAAS